MKNIKRRFKEAKLGVMDYILFGIFLSVLMVMFIHPASALDINGKQNSCIELPQSENATYCNITAIKYPNGTTDLVSYEMTGSGMSWKYSFCDTSQLGTYYALGECSSGAWDYGFDVTENGESFTDTQGYLILGQLGIIGLLLVISFSFDKAKWKLRSFFHMAALLMGIITLNSIRLISGASTSLTSMGNMGLILGIVILIFMFLFIFINYLIELFRYFKKKNINKFEVEEQV